jgi:hypothetical protein
VLFVIYSMMAVRGYLRWRADLLKAEALAAHA